MPLGNYFKRFMRFMQKRKKTFDYDKLAKVAKEDFEHMRALERITPLKMYARMKSSGKH